VKHVRTSLVTIAVIPLGILLVHAVGALPSTASGLTEAVARELSVHPVSHPVTAVLLDFRAYDTWLEVTVLLLAAIAALAVRRSADLRDVVPDTDVPPVLLWSARFALPFLILIAGYLFWLGTHAPGGAFQAGAVLAGAGVLALHAGVLPSRLLVRPLLHWLLTSGVIAFLLAASASLLVEGTLLRMDSAWRIIAVEALVTISIAATLTALFIAGRPVPGMGGEDSR
jgi:multisubunit Na+/H+ antiporter MnhB subunit